MKQHIDESLWAELRSASAMISSSNGQLVEEELRGLELLLDRAAEVIGNSVRLIREIKEHPVTEEEVKWLEDTNEALGSIVGLTEDGTIDAETLYGRALIEKLRHISTLA